MVTQFYERNDISALLPGMKDCIIIRNESGEKEKVQKRLLFEESRRWPTCKVHVFCRLSSESCVVFSEKCRSVIP